MIRSFFLLIKSLILSGIIFNSCGNNYSDDASWAMRSLKDLSLRQKISQMLVYRMNMRFISSSNKKWIEINEMITKEGIGGIHIYYGDVGSSLTLLNDLQRKSKIPILVDADIENGLYQRFPEGTELPPFMALGATGDQGLIYQAGKIVATEARAVGVHLNFAPVVDINNNPKNPIINTRSFGEDPEQVSSFGKSYLKGLQDYGMLATAKHFPGHGDTETDSHSSLARIPSDEKRLWSTELKPFQVAIEAGVDAVMISHVNAPGYQFNADIPATLSKFWVTEILRDSLGYEGVVVTDAMAMGGITNNYSDAYALIESIKAGCDFIIQNDDFIGSVDIIERAVLDGEISEERINSSALKILRMKEKIGLNDNRFVSLENAQTALRDSSFRTISNSIASKSLTLVRNNSKFFPLKLKKQEKLYLIDVYDHPNDHSESITTKALRNMGANLKSFQVDESDNKFVFNSILAQIPTGAKIIINAFVNPSSRKDRITLSRRQQSFIKSLNQKSKNVLLNSYGSPYLIEAFAGIGNYICSWKGSRTMQNAFVMALTGREKISGKLPITIPGIAERSYGIEIEKKPVWFTQKNKKEVGEKLKWVTPFETGAKVKNLENLLNQAVEDSAWPGSVLLAARNGKVFFHKASGYHTYDKSRVMSPSDIFDIASITKIVSTTSAVMHLVQNKKLKLDTKIAEIVPEFASKKIKSSELKKEISVKHLLTHTAGFPPFKKYYLEDISPQEIFFDIMDTELLFQPGTRTVYSDLGLILLGNIVNNISGLKLEEYTEKYLLAPLGMESTFYNPLIEFRGRIVPTEIVSGYRNGLLHGEVHDENAHKLGGVAGHAGLFSSARDLGIFAQTILQGGIYGNKRIFKESTLQKFITKALVDTSSSRCLGWDSPSGEASGGIYISDNGYGHNGYTGTSLWIDPDYKLIVILLTNAVHPRREKKSPKYFEWRQKIHSSVYESLGITKRNPNLKIKERWIGTFLDSTIIEKEIN
tara:strand:+ start:25625 stop:28594 length:2970 start_codon:yes stop_codon:yes gene_type:complete